jgi:DNA-binding HxlR family transcriptional regulator
VSNDSHGTEFELTDLGRSLLVPVDALLIWAESNREALRAARDAELRRPRRTATAEANWRARSDRP